MAKHVQVQLIDDLDGVTEATETVSFGLDGVAYEIDLTDRHASDLRAALTTYVGAARMVGRASAKRRSTTPSMRRPS